MTRDRGEQAVQAAGGRWVEAGHGRHTPATRQCLEIPSPGGPASRRAGLTSPDSCFVRVSLCSRLRELLSPELYLNRWQR